MDKGLINDLKQELSELEKNPRHFSPEFLKGFAACISDAIICLKENNNYDQSASLKAENDRLREALESIKRQLPATPVMFSTVYNIINKALSQPKEETK